jgi:hypothetical protein
MATVKQISSMSELQGIADNIYDIGSPRVIVEERKNKDDASVSYSAYLKLSPGGLSKLPYEAQAVNIQDLLTKAAKAFADTRGKNKAKQYKNAQNKQNVKDIKSYMDNIEKQLLNYIPASMRGWTQRKITSDQLLFLRKQDPQSNNTKQLSALIAEWDNLSKQLNPQQVTVARPPPPTLASEIAAGRGREPARTQGAPLTGPRQGPVGRGQARLELLKGGQVSRKLVKRKNHTKRVRKTK